MAVIQNPGSANYGWILPVVGGSIGVWGGILNIVFAEDGATGDTKGVDQVVGELQGEVDTLETDLDALETRVTTLEAAGLGANYARISKRVGDGGQSVPARTLVKVTFPTTDFDTGNITPTADTLTIPTGGAGLWQIRAVAQLRYHSNADDSLNYRLEVHHTPFGQTAVKVAEAEVPHLNDGISSQSEDHTLIAGLDIVAGDGDLFEVFVWASDPDNSIAGFVRGGDGTYFEGVRVAPDTTT
jgi:hypothetical protein